ncbi:B-lymphocyte antigen CD19 isoform X2 [Hyla sarda]|uniref:B-lymphocyte antigen CD19 isoform X2 n=1 Tax=Hyla sarda TaxID=327740 RepID=UPI0024C273E4|nr:B-lymphocyte antigen CD19 isoform X2 [Hyla sarda]
MGDNENDLSALNLLFPGINCIRGVWQRLMSTCWPKYRPRCPPDPSAGGISDHYPAVIEVVGHIAPLDISGVETIIMLLLLVLCLGITCSAQNPGHPGIITVHAEGSTSLPCGSYTTSPVPLMLKLQMEENSNGSWVVVGMTPIILKLDTNNPSLLLTSSGYKDTSCSVDNMTSHVSLIGRTDNGLRNMMTSVPDQMEWITCHAPQNWTLLQWSRGGEIIAMVQRAEIVLNVLVERNASSFLITSTIRNYTGNYCCLEEPTIKKLNVTCRWWTHKSAIGWQRFIDARYWIIVVVALSSSLMSLMLLGCFVSMKRRRRARRQARSRFFKVSTAARNLYKDSIPQDTDIAHKDQDFTYQNVSLSPTKALTDDRFSDKSSFLSLGGDSYLEPIADGVDQVSDGGCYENATQDRDDREGSLDGGCYENANEEIKEGSIGSQSYEDMKGSICIRTKTEAPPTEGITQDEDADSYENMQAPLYSQLDRSCNRSTEDQTEPPAHQTPWKVPIELQKQNGDFYFSYENNKL